MQYWTCSNHYNISEHLKKNWKALVFDLTKNHHRLDFEGRRKAELIYKLYVRSRSWILNWYCSVSNITTFPLSQNLKLGHPSFNHSTNNPNNYADFQVKSILSEYRIHNADIVLRYDATVDDFIDVVEGNRIYIPCIYLLNKIDQISVEELDIVSEIPHCVPISAHHKWNYDSLLEKVIIILCNQESILDIIMYYQFLISL